MSTFVERPTVYEATQVEKVDFEDPAVKILRRYGGVNIIPANPSGRWPKNDRVIYVRTKYIDLKVRACDEGGDVDKVRGGQEVWIEAGDWVITTDNTLTIYPDKHFKTRFMSAPNLGGA